MESGPSEDVRKQRSQARRERICVNRHFIIFAGSLALILAIAIGALIMFVLPSDTAPTQNATETSQVVEEVDSVRDPLFTVKGLSILLAALLVTILTVKEYFVRKCQACGKNWAMKRVKLYYLLWFPDDGMYEYRCKYCDQRRWVCRFNHIS